MFLWMDLVALVVHPIRAIPAIDRDRRGLQGAIALGLSVLIPAVLAEVAAFGPYRPPTGLGSLPSLTTQGADIYARWVYQHRFVLPIYEVLGGLLLWVLAGAAIHGAARALKGRGQLAGFVKLVGFVALVGLVSVPVSALQTIARLSANPAAALSVASAGTALGIGVFVWQNVLLILAAQAHYGLSTERAVTAVLGPVGCLAVLLFGLIVLAAIATVLIRPIGSL
jgi:Yip1 domain